MVNLFISLRFWDIIDIVLVAFLMYQIYMLIKGTVAFNIFVGILLFYFLWKLTNALQMQMVSSILGQVIGGGVIALIIVFQQEIRKLLILVGTRYFPNMQFSIENLFANPHKPGIGVRIKSIHKACNRMAQTQTGALIVIKRLNSLDMLSNTGDILNALTSSRLLESIFMKNGPLHDGAVIIENDIIRAARCVLPVSENFNLPAHLGMRHRAGLGASENTDAITIIISEERGQISIADRGELIENISSKQLMDILNQNFQN